MGGSGGSGYRFLPSSDADRLKERAIEDAQIAGFQTRLSEVLGDLLFGYNDRNHELVSDRLETILEALHDEHDGPFSRLFGGSVAKHTYVDGLSDIDCLVKVDESELHDHTPAEVLERIADIVRGGVDDVTVKVGRMAVTVTYGDGMELQLLPAHDAGNGRLQVPKGDGEEWARINPQTFRTVLSKRNDECAGKLVPTIKLAKAVLAAQQPDLLTGYHVESLAIEAFRNYDGLKTNAEMLPAFFERARTLVLQPIRDSTGQSVHVDADLGPENSLQRQRASLALGRIARQMRTASVIGSEGRWLDLFGLDE
jgi:hypothetical protein